MPGVMATRRTGEKPATNAASHGQPSRQPARAASHQISRTRQAEREPSTHAAVAARIGPVWNNPSAARLNNTVPYTHHPRDEPAPATPSGPNGRRRSHGNGPAPHRAAPS